MIKYEMCRRKHHRQYEAQSSEIAITYHQNMTETFVVVRIGPILA